MRGDWRLTLWKFPSLAEDFFSLVCRVRNLQTYNYNSIPPLEQMHVISYWYSSGVSWRFFCQPDPDSSSVHTSPSFFRLTCYLLTPVAFRGLLISSGATLLVLEDRKCLGVYLTSPSWCPATDGLGVCCGTKGLYPLHLPMYILKP